jgi:hypothetical protein
MPRAIDGSYMVAFPSPSVSYVGLISTMLTGAPHRMPDEHELRGVAAGRRRSSVCGGSTSGTTAREGNSWYRRVNDGHPRDALPSAATSPDGSTLTTRGGNATVDRAWRRSSRNMKYRLVGPNGSRRRCRADVWCRAGPTDHRRHHDVTVGDRRSGSRLCADGGDRADTERTHVAISRRSVAVLSPRMKLGSLERSMGRLPEPNRSRRHPIGGGAVVRRQHEPRPPPPARSGRSEHRRSDELGDLAERGRAERSRCARASSRDSRWRTRCCRHVPDHRRAQQRNVTQADALAGRSSTRALVIRWSTTVG